jgi:hypothetical protein
MFHQFYATTKDKKGHEHNYRLPAGEAVPSGHEITDLSVAGRFKFSEIVGDKMAKDLKELFPVKKRDRAKA